MPRRADRAKEWRRAAADRPPGRAKGRAGGKKPAPLRGRTQRMRLYSLPVPVFEDTGDCYAIWRQTARRAGRRQSHSVLRP